MGEEAERSSESTGGIAYQRFYRGEPSTERERGGEAALLVATEGVTPCLRERSERRLVRASL